MGLISGCRIFWSLALSVLWSPQCPFWTQIAVLGIGGRVSTGAVEGAQGRQMTCLPETELVSDQYLGNKVRTETWER